MLDAKNVYFWAYLNENENLIVVKQGERQCEGDKFISNGGGYTLI